MTRQPLGLHGETHLPDGQDPIPGVFIGRVAWGTIFGDGVSEYPGSGDWSSTSGGTCIIVTFDPVFSSRPTVFVTPSVGDAYFTDADVPSFGTYSDYSSGLPLTSISADFGTLYIVFYDPDGNLFNPGFSFDFLAVASG